MRQPGKVLKLRGNQAKSSNYEATMQSVQQCKVKAQLWVRPQLWGGFANLRPQIWGKNVLQSFDNDN